LWGGKGKTKGGGKEKGRTIEPTAKKGLETSKGGVSPFREAEIRD